MKKLTLSVLALFLLSGCTITNPPISAYRVFIPKNQSSLEESYCRDKSIKVALSFAKNSLMTEKMKYAKDHYSEYAFSESEWAQSPSKAITHEIFETLRASKLFKSVQNYKSRSKSQYILESSIEEFIQHFDTESKSSYAVVSLSFVLVEEKTSQVVDSIHLSKNIPVKSLNAKAGVEALSEGLAQILHEKNIWLAKACK
jgi:cholesterol transport system auxiliary component